MTRKEADKISKTIEDGIPGMEGFHLVYPEHIDRIGRYAATIGQGANKCRSGSDTWKAAIYKLSGMIEALQKLRIPATIDWGKGDCIAAVLIDGRQYPCTEQAALFGPTVARKEAQG